MKPAGKQTLAAMFAAGLVLAACAREEPLGPPPDERFVEAVSAGVLGRMEAVRVVFAERQDSSVLPPAGSFSLSPAVSGTLSWLDEFTLAFTPTAPFKAGQRYVVNVSIDGIDPFSFDFTAGFPHLDVALDPVIIDEDGKAVVRGTLDIDAGSDIAGIETAVSSPQLGRPTWSHEEGSHRFTFPGVTLLNAAYGVEVVWDGRRLGSDERGTAELTIPGTGVFEVTGFYLNSGVVEVSFSAPLPENRDLRGFITMNGQTNVRHSVERNIIRIFGEASGGILPGTEIVIQDITDVNGRVLAVPVQHRIQERWELPQVRFAGTGNILPTSQGGRLVVETRNLSGLLIEAFRVNGENMLQFLQVNGLDGERELDRVGEPVWTQAFDFGWTGIEQNRWIRRGLDLSELSRKYPGAMFRIRVSFRPRHVHYECDAEHGNFDNLTFPDDSFPSYLPWDVKENSYWRTYQNLPGFNWNDWYRFRNDPCHPSFYTNYYNRDTIIGRNVLVSDLGLAAKRDIDGSLLVAATNLISAAPVRNVEFRIHNFQGRVIHQGRTGADGLAAIPPSATAGQDSRLFITASGDLGRAFLRVQDALALATSHFDVLGGTPASGVRGLIYGERGVWRPGDEIFLTFLLSDPRQTLPPDHPVSLEFEDPRGRIAVQRTFTSSVDGFYRMAVSTAPDAPTGNWTARVRVGGSVFTRAVRVETVVPNRLRMDLDFGGAGMIRSGERQVSLLAEWLFGAPAPGLRGDISVAFHDRETVFPGFAEFTFRDPSRAVSSERTVLWEGNLDSAGRAAFPLKLNPGDSVPGKVTASFMTRVFEPSGMFSSEQVSSEYSPYPRYVGIRLPDFGRNDWLPVDTDHKVEIVVLDEDGKPAQGRLDLTAAVYKVDWRWWWERGREEAAQFASSLSRRPVSRGEVTAVNGRAVFNFRIDRSEWGRFLVVVRDNSGGHAAAQTVYAGYSWRAQEGGQDSQAMLTLTPGKPTYDTGERIAVSFPSNKEAMALVTVEKGGQVVNSRWVNCEDGTTTYEFAAEPAMAPNIYVHVMLIQPHLQTQNDLPIRLYGITPVFVEDPRTALAPRITAPESWQAESSASFTVSEASGRPMTYTVAVVDEGLLGLTRFTLPDARGVFYAREASFLQSWDIFRDVIGAYSGSLETLLAIGGSDDGPPPDGGRDAQRFKPLVRFFGPYELAAGARKTETFDLPPYIGAARIMVMAASSGTETRASQSQRAYGTVEQPVRVISDLMVFATLPRVLSPDDEVIVPVSVNSFAEGRRSVRVSLAAVGAAIQGTAVQTVTFDGPGERLVRFTAKAPANPGIAVFTAGAESAGLKTARHETEMEIRSTAIPVTASDFNLLLPGETWQGNLAYPGREGTNTLTASFSRLPPVNLERRLNFLITYPHGCLEQTTSGAFPQLYLSRILDLDQTRTAEIEANVAAAIRRLAVFQTATGGFSFWPNEIDAHDWGTSYAGHFLLEARRAGYAVPDNLINGWLQFQKNRAALWQTRNEMFTEQAYRLYTIALAGSADLGSMNRLRDRRDIPLQAQWRLAAAYWLAGQRDTARTMIRELPFPGEVRRELSGTFASPLRDRAMVLEALILIAGGGVRDGGQLPLQGSAPGSFPTEADRIRTLFESIALALSQDTWLSTQETAFSLIAIAPYIRNAGGGEPIAVTYNAAGRRNDLVLSAPMAEQPLGSVSGTGSAFSVTNNSSGPLYATFTARGLPEEGGEPSLAEGLALEVRYLNADGGPVDPATLNPGEDMEVRVTVRNLTARTVEEIALVVPVPASQEILNTRLAAPDVAAAPADFRFQDIRDDRVMTYLDLAPGQSKTVSFRVNKTYDGTFFTPAIHAYAMYDDTIRALIPGRR